MSWLQEINVLLNYFFVADIGVNLSYVNKKQKYLSCNLFSMFSTFFVVLVVYL